MSEHLAEQAVYLSIILPAYNEAGNIVNAVEANLAAARACAVSFELVVVDDGSTDATGRLLAELKPRCPELRVITHETNQGIGAGIRTGLQAARGEFFVLSPADSPHTAETLQRYLDASPNADIVLGYREEKLGYSLLMKYNSRFYHWVLRLVCGLPYRDVNWIQLYRRRVFEQIEIEFNGIVMQAEVVVKAHALGMRFREVPCPMMERVHGKAGASRPKVMLRTGKDLLRLLWRWQFGDLKAKLGRGLLKVERPSSLLSTSAELRRG